MRIFITGSEGFIGSHLVEHLIKHNHKITALVLYNFSNSIGWLKYIDNNSLKKIKIIHGDVKDFNFMKKVTKNHDILINLSALIGIPYSYQAVKSYIDTNITGCHNLLECTKENNIKQFIHTSTSEVYGSAQKIPIRENHQINSQSPYAATKASADQLCLSYFKSFDLPVTILRPFNTFGPRQSNRAIIPVIINQLLNQKKYIKVGNIIPTRDLNYVTDTVEAFRLSLKKKNTFGQIINIGAGREISIKNLIFLLMKVTGKKKRIVIEKNRERPKSSEVLRLYSSNSKAKKLLNWKPKFAGKNGLEIALGKTVDWYKKNKNKFTNSDYII